jgi:putative effector of murein hydrolase
MSNLSKLKLGKFVATIVALSSISAILSTAEQAEAFPAPTILHPFLLLQSAVNPILMLVSTEITIFSGMRDMLLVPLIHPTQNLVTR